MKPVAGQPLADLHRGSRVPYNIYNGVKSSRKIARGAWWWRALEFRKSTSGRVRVHFKAGGRSGAAHADMSADKFIAR
jgi:hypothetical protein